MALTNVLNHFKLKQEDIGFLVFILSVAILPLGLGGNRPLPLGVTQAGLALSFLLCAYNQNWLQAINIPKRIVWALYGFAAVLLWGFIQTLPIMPESIAHPLWAEAARTLGKPITGSIAIDPEAARYGLMRLFTYISIGMGAYLFAQDSACARHMVQIIWLTGVATCAYGLLMQLFGIEKILWVKKWSYIGDLTGTFVNRNHFAIYAAMIMLCGVALLVQSLREHLHDVKERQKIKAFQVWLQKEGLLRFFGLLLVLLCVIYSHSRAGLMLALAGPCLYTFFYQIYRRRFKMAIAFAFIGMICIFGAAVLANSFLDRFAHVLADDSSQSRFRVYELTTRAIQDNPLLGYGLNGFETIYRLYQPGKVLEFNRAHSDVLESLLDLGLPAGLVLWAAIALLLSGLWHGITTRRKHGLFPTLAFSASLIVLMHVCVDFSLQIPGVTAIFVCLLGSGLAQSWSRAHEHPLS